MYRAKVSVSRSLRVTKVNKSCRIIDYSPGDYVRNSFGFIRNDFSQLVESNDALAMERALQKMQEISSNEPDNSNKSFDEIVAMVRPRYIQSPAELDRFELYCIDNALDTYSKLKGLDDEQKEALAKAKQEDLKRTLSEMSEADRVAFFKSAISSPGVSKTE